MKKNISGFALMAAFGMGLLAGSPADADQFLGSYHVKTTFAEGTQTAGITAEEVFVGCLWNIVFIDLGTLAGRSQFALAISAKATQQTITRLDYTVDSNGKCFVSGLHVE